MKLQLANPYFIKQLLKCKSNIENSTEAFRPPLDSRNAQPQHNCRDRGWYKNICHSGMLCRMVQTQTTNDVSNGQYKSRKVTHGNKYLRNRHSLKSHGVHQEAQTVSSQTSATSRQLSRKRTR